MADEGYLLGESLLREIKRELNAARLKITTLERRLATVSVRRHQGVYMPSRRTTRFRNDSGEEVPPYAVMKVTGGIAGPFITIDKPDTTFERLYLVNGKRAVGANKKGDGTWLTESDYIAYNSSSGTPAYGEVWGPKSGQWTLEKYRHGFLIQGHTATIDSVNVVLATQHLVTKVKGKTDASHAKGATGTVSLYDTNGVDTTVNISDVLNPFAAVGATKWVHVSWIGDDPELSAAEC